MTKKLNSPLHGPILHSLHAPILGGVSSVPAAPVNTVAPALSGTPQVGQTLTTSNGTWTGSPTPTYTYQWKRGAATIGGATANTYDLVSADDGTTITCAVTATNASGFATAASNGLAVTFPVPVVTVSPIVTGTATVGSTLTSTAGTWNYTVTPTYQWQRDTVNISGATASTYLLAAPDGGTSVRCVVTGTNSGGATAANSNALAIGAADTTAPIIANLAFTDPNVTLDSDEAGTLYGVLTVAATAPTATQIKAGQNSGGTAAAFAFNFSLVSGANSSAPFASAPGGTYYLHVMEDDAALNKSNVLTLATTVTFADTVPDAFAFTDQTGVAISTLITSNTITVAGIDAASPISITGGTYKINAGAYTSASGTVVNGDSVTLQRTSSASNSTGLDTVLTIGGVSDTWTITTTAGASMTKTNYSWYRNGSFAATHTANSGNSGLPASLPAGRWLVLVNIRNPGGTTATMTIDGVTATNLSTFANGISDQHVFEATTTASGSNNIVLSLSPSAAASMSFYRLTGAATATITPVQQNFASSGSTPVLNFDRTVVAGNIVVATYIKPSTGYTFTGFAVDDVSDVLSSRYPGSASKVLVGGSPETLRIEGTATFQQLSGIAVFVEL